MKCISSGKESDACVKFPCPSCGTEIARSPRCRRLSIEYQCPSCELRGP